MTAPSILSVNGNYEEVYRDYEIFIEPSPDHYTEGFDWSVCKDATEIGSGLDFTQEAALAAARQCIDRLG